MKTKTKHKIKIIGKVVDGLGEGKFFMSLDGYKKGFYKYLNYYPYKGTLNLSLDKKNLKLFKNAIKKLKKYKINGFKENKKKYYPIKLIKIKAKNLKGAAIFPYYKHHPENIVELVFRFNIRKKFQLKNFQNFEFEFDLKN
jgi:riboflavin kinase